MEIVAHRGIHDSLPENSLAAFEAAIELGSDVVEFDVRLTRDRVPVVIHSLECAIALDGLNGYLFEHDLSELRAVRLKGSPQGRPQQISTLAEVLDGLAGRIGMEIEIKDPSVGLAEQVAKSLVPHRRHWDSIEVTSFEPAILRAFSAAIGRRVPVDLLFPRSENWMTLPIVTYLAYEKAGLAGARAVHLHPAQLDATVIDHLRAAHFDVHAWDVNDRETFDRVSRLGIVRVSTDNVPRLLSPRDPAGPAPSQGQPR
ncbi:MAG TPA: glycerophosphodiester phosphodiesterase [Candidatus Limnocylindria bacterium]